MHICLWIKVYAWPKFSWVLCDVFSSNHIFTAITPYPVAEQKGWAREAVRPGQHVVTIIGKGEGWQHFPPFLKSGQTNQPSLRMGKHAPPLLWGWVTRPAPHYFEGGQHVPPTFHFGQHAPSLSLRVENMPPPPFFFFEDGKHVSPSSNGGQTCPPPTSFRKGKIRPYFEDGQTRLPPPPCVEVNLGVLSCWWW